MSKKYLTYFLFFVLSVSAEEKTNNDFKYYFVDLPECQIPIPYMLKINATHLEDRGLRFFYIKSDLDFKKILISPKNSDSFKKIKKLAKKTDLQITEERKISFLTLLKYQTKKFMGKRTNRFFLFGKSFVFSYGGGTDKEMEYIINHCLETAKKSDE